VFLSDDLCDEGPLEKRVLGFDAWSERVRNALDVGTAADHPVLKAFLHTCAARGFPRSWIDAYLRGTRIDLDFRGFATEADYQHYVDQIAWPALMLSCGLVHAGGGDAYFADCCRILADAAQRTDFLTDLRNDLRSGRLYLPQADLDRFGVHRVDLEQGRDTNGVRALLHHAIRAARDTLRNAHRILNVVPIEQRPLTQCLLALFDHRLDTVAALGPAITRRAASVRITTGLRILISGRRQARQYWKSRRPAPPSTGSDAADRRHNAR
jgi:phytoene synthase